jgi:hypothetical protein
MQDRVFSFVTRVSGLRRALSSPIQSTNADRRERCKRGEMAVCARAAGDGPSSYLQW